MNTTQITPEAFSQRFGALPLDAESTALLLSVLETKDLSAGGKLIAHGWFNDTLYLVWSGRLLMTISTDGTKLTLGEVQPGRWVGEFGFIEPGEAAADVTAAEDTTVLALSLESMNKLYEKNPNTASALLQAISLELARRLRATGVHNLEKSAEGD